MRHITLAVMTSLLALPVIAEDATVSADSSVELRISGTLYAPNGAAATGDSESGLVSVDWDKGNGFEAQGILWRSNSPWGFALSIGTASWDIDDYGDITGNELNAFTGDADMTVFGASLIRQLSTDRPDQSKFKADLELGIRYVKMDSNIEGIYGVAVSGGPIYVRQTVELDDNILGLIALSGHYELDPQWSLFLQGGFQFDLDKGDAINAVPGVGEYAAGETELQSLFGKAGISFTF